MLKRTVLTQIMPKKTHKKTFIMYTSVLINNRIVNQEKLRVMLYFDFHKNPYMATVYRDQTEFHRLLKLSNACGFLETANLWVKRWVPSGAILFAETKFIKK